MLAEARLSWLGARCLLVNRGERGDELIRGQGVRHAATELVDLAECGRLMQTPAGAVVLAEAMMTRGNVVDVVGAQACRRLRVEDEASWAQRSSGASRGPFLKPSVLLFDEATSALDNRTQAVVTESLSALRVTQIIIAHRLSTVQTADRIYVLSSGEIIQRGTFSELMSQDGLFADMMRRQQL